MENYKIFVYETQNALQSNDGRPETSWRTRGKNLPSLPNHSSHLLFHSITCSRSRTELSTWTNTAAKGFRMEIYYASICIWVVRRINNHRALLSSSSFFLVTKAHDGCGSDCRLLESQHLKPFWLTCFQFRNHSSIHGRCFLTKSYFSTVTDWGGLASRCYPYSLASK